MSESEHLGSRSTFSLDESLRVQARVTNPHLTVFPELNERIRICILRTVECSTDAVHSHALPPLLGCGWQQTRDSDGEAALN